MLQVNGTTIGHVASKTQKGANSVCKRDNVAIQPYVTSRSPVELTIMVSCLDVDAAVTALLSMMATTSDFALSETDGYALFNDVPFAWGKLKPLSPEHIHMRNGTITLTLIMAARQEDHPNHPANEGQVTP
jgi:hypothetical protein